MKVLATYNIKGGVGKTASAVNLAYLAARGGARTLVWDLDPQGAASYYFRVGPRDKMGARALVRGKHELDGLIRATDHVERMGPHQAPVGVFAPHSRAAVGYEELWAEIEAALLAQVL